MRLRSLLNPRNSSSVMHSLTIGIARAILSAALRSILQSSCNGWIAQRSEQHRAFVVKLARDKVFCRLKRPALVVRHPVLLFSEQDISARLALHAAKEPPCALKRSAQFQAPNNGASARTGTRVAEGDDCLKVVKRNALHFLFFSRITTFSPSSERYASGRVT